MPEDSPEAFALFARWIYSEDIEHDPVQDQSSALSSIIDAWIFGDKIMAPGFQNELMLCLAHFWKPTMIVPKPITLISIYDRTSKGSPLRKWIIWCVARLVNEEWVDAHFTALLKSRAIMLDLCRAQMQL